MTDKQPEALSIANRLKNQQQPLSLALREKAAAELRRLHEANAELVEALKEIITWYGARDSSDTLLPAINQNPEIYEAMRVIAKATGENND